MRGTFLGWVGVVVLAAGTSLGCDSSSGDSDEGQAPMDPGGPIDIHYGETTVPPDDGNPPADAEDPGMPSDPGADAPPPFDPGGDPAADTAVPDTVVQDPGAGDVEDTYDPGPPCDYPTSAYGFQDNCDGTLLDRNTGLLWQKAYESFSTLDNARAACNASRERNLLGWRLPTIDELRGLVRGCPATEPSGACPVHDSSTSDTAVTSACTQGCPINQGPVEKPGDPAKKCYMDATFDWQCHLFVSGTQVTTSGGKRSWYLTFYDAAINVPPSATAPLNGFYRCVHDPL